MKKWLIIGTLSGLVLIFLVLPILVGFALERGYPALLAGLRDQAEGRYSVEGSFDRGLLSSAAQARIQFSSEDGEAVALRLDQAWIHGPFSLPEWFRGNFPFPPVLTFVRAELRPEAGNGDDRAVDPAGWLLADLMLRVNFDGTLDIEALSPAFELPGGFVTGDEMRAEVAIQGGVRGGRGKAELGEVRFQAGESRARLAPTTIRFHGAVTDAGSKVEGTFDLGRARLESSANRVTDLAASFGTFSASRAPNELDISVIDIDLGDVEFSEPGGSTPGGIAQGGRLRIDARSAGGRLARMKLVLSLDALLVGEKSLGPGLVRVALRGVDLSAAASFRDALANLDPSPEISEAALEAETRLLREWIPVLVAGSPEFEVERFELDGPGGRLEGEGWLKIDGSDPTAFARELTTMQAIEARGEFFLPIPILHGWLDTFLMKTMEVEAAGLPREEIVAMTEFMREMAVSRLLETGFLRLEDERYRIEFRFEEGVSIVNGKLLGPGGLMSLLSGG